MNQKPQQARCHSKEVAPPEVQEGQAAYASGALEGRFDIPMVALLARKEKQIQQSYRPVIGVHKWFARRPGSLFRALLLSEFGCAGTLRHLYFSSNFLSGYTVLDPFMGGGTPLFEANRLGMNVIGFDVNPLAYWIVRQELVPLDRQRFRRVADALVEETEAEIGKLYRTTCTECGARDAVAKYFLWIKQHTCPSCTAPFDLSPGPLVAEDVRHPRNVVHCPHCHELSEVDTIEGSIRCRSCRRTFTMRGNARGNTYMCPSCSHTGKYPQELGEAGPPMHRLFAIEYHCGRCKPTHKGRFFKTPDAADIRRFSDARKRLQALNPRIPNDEIPDGLETKRVHRWGYRRYRELFNDRQLLGLGILAEKIRALPDADARHALATVFSDTLRYQNMVCRYDTMALKCQDIFSVHGFPIGLIECENNLLGIPKVGSGGFRHFVEKFDRAKAYCEQPFETTFDSSGRKQLVTIPGERIDAHVVKRWPASPKARTALLSARSIQDVQLPKGVVDGVFTDPPYYDNVQYAELMDFCYVWLRQILGEEVPEFALPSTRTDRELTGNAHIGKDLGHFTVGLSGVFTRAVQALRPGGPFVFTYHHNDMEAYAPVCVALLDAGLVCTSVLAAPAEMGASLHINGTGSSVVDSIIVARRAPAAHTMDLSEPATLGRVLQEDVDALARGGLCPTRGDVTCLALGLLMASVNRELHKTWDVARPVAGKLESVLGLLSTAAMRVDLENLVPSVLRSVPTRTPASVQLSMFAEERA